ncbi:MAG: phospholipid carrier-dependent glycosyltransferase [Patescibacteria group bacterium]
MKSIFYKNFYVIVMFVFVLRLLLAFLPSFTIDMNNWIAWSGMLGEVGPLKFYSLPGWTDYTPGFLYHLWLLGIINKSLHFAASLYPFLVKLPVIVADIGIGILLYKILLKKNFKLASLAFLAYTINPVVMFTNSIWGQTDGLITFFLLLSAYFLAEKKNILLSSFFWVLALFVKPQALLALPIFLIYLFLCKKLKKMVFFILFSLVFILLIGLPFFAHSDPVLGLPKLIAAMSNESPFTSVMAFNFWALVKGTWIPDSGTFLGIKYVYWGTILLVSTLSLVFLKMAKSVKKPQNLYFYLGLAYLAFFLFPTRVHERYILVSLPFFLLSAGLIYSKIEFILFFFLSGLALINIYHPYAYYTQESFLSSIKILEITTSSYKFVSLLYVLLFFAYLFKDKIQKSLKLNINLSKMFVRKKGKEPSFPVCNLTQRYIKYSLIAILLFSFLTRVGWLGSPKSEYFDEVYHAFTARLILHNDPKAWEWWNPHPEGFAYEWTHPPLAKLGMLLGMKMFGENSFGWRFPGALLGVGSVLLVFLLASEIFKDKLTGILSSAVFALDGLPVVMSRIGMNDSYILFFVLLSIYLFIKKQDYLSAFSFGLALSSKWSVIWAIPILFVLWLGRKKKISVGLLWFLLLPPIIYLVSYAPMFWTGHNLNIFW